MKPADLVPSPELLNLFQVEKEGICVGNTMVGTMPVEVWRSEIQRGLEKYILYDTNNRQVGFITLMYPGKDALYGDMPYLQISFMKSSREKKGVGTRLHQIAIERSLQLEGYEGRVGLTSASEALSFHANRGFRCAEGTKMYLPLGVIERWQGIIAKSPILTRPIPN